MQKYERVKIFKSSKPAKVEEDYAKWYKELSDKQKQDAEICEDFIVTGREVSIQTNGKSTIVVIAVFYIDYDLGNPGYAGDVGKHLDKTGVSAFGRSRKSFGS